jgi:hypothetical protein
MTRIISDRSLTCYFTSAAPKDRFVDERKADQNSYQRMRHYHSWGLAADSGSCPCRRPV